LKIKLFRIKYGTLEKILVFIEKSVDGEDLNTHSSYHSLTYYFTPAPSLPVVVAVVIIHHHMLNYLSLSASSSSSSSETIQ
jgi:hypothetical protein